MKHHMMHFAQYIQIILSTWLSVRDQILNLRIIKRPIFSLSWRCVNAVLKIFWLVSKAVQHEYMQAQQLCQGNFDSRWTRDHCETFTEYLLLHFIPVPVGPASVDVACRNKDRRSLQVNNNKEKCAHFCQCISVSTSVVVGGRGEGIMLTPPVLRTVSQQKILVQIFFSFVSIKMCLCSLESQQTHNKLSDSVKCTLRWNTESL